MFHIRKFNVIPPGGWYYQQPETGMIVTGSTIHELAARVAGHRQANGIPVTGDLVEEMENHICERINGNKEFCKEARGPRPRRTVGWREALAFMEVAVAWVKQGASFVEQEEAERRAVICAGCPQNVPVSGCGVCRAGVEALLSVLGGRKTSKDKNLQACGVCGCANKAQVHFPLEVLRSGVREEMQFPARCWKKSPRLP